MAKATGVAVIDFHVGGFVTGSAASILLDDQLAIRFEGETVASDGSKKPFSRREGF